MNSNDARRKFQRVAEKGPASAESCLVIPWSSVEAVLKEMTPHLTLRFLMPELVEAFRDRARFLPPEQVLKEIIGTVVAIRYDGFDPSDSTKVN